MLVNVSVIWSINTRKWSPSSVPVSYCCRFLHLIGSKIQTQRHSVGPFHAQTSLNWTSHKKSFSSSLSLLFLFTNQLIMLQILISIIFTHDELLPCPAVSAVCTAHPPPPLFLVIVSCINVFTCIFFMFTLFSVCDESVSGLVFFLLAGFMWWRSCAAALSNNSYS